MALLEETDDASDQVGEVEKPSSAGKKAIEDGDQPEGSDDDGEDEEDDSEEEYEIEAIIDSKRGMFAKGEQGFLVKWKGYDSSQNSWVAESDAGNAKDLIDEFFASKARAKAKTQTSKSVSARSREPSSAKSAKKNRETSESASVSATKRGRGKAGNASSDETEEETNSRKTKKSRESASANGKNKKRGTLSALNGTDDEDVRMADVHEVLDEGGRPYTTMKELKLGSLKNWEDHVKTVTTVERLGGGDLMIFFETTDGQYVREPSKTCAKRFPQKLIQFYESHLRWKLAEGDIPE